MIDFRNANHQDLNTIVRLEIETMKELRGRIGDSFPVFDEKRNSETSLISIIEGECGCAIVALDEENFQNRHIVGAIIALDSEYASSNEADRESLVLMNVFVDEEYRTRGIGSELVSRMERFAVEKKYRDIVTGIVTPNAIISHMLEKRGYPITRETRTKSLIRQ